jgi:hypothetical protein
MAPLRSRAARAAVGADDMTGAAGGGGGVTGKGVLLLMMPSVTDINGAGGVAARWKEYTNELEIEGWQVELWTVDSTDPATKVGLALPPGCRVGFVDPIYWLLYQWVPTNARPTRAEPTPLPRGVTRLVTCVVHTACNQSTGVLMNDCKMSWWTKVPTLTRRCRATTSPTSRERSRTRPG